MINQLKAMGLSAVLFITACSTAEKNTTPLQANKIIDNPVVVPNEKSDNLADQYQDDLTCLQIQKIAAQIMRGRQNGEPANVRIALNDQKNGHDRVIHDYYERMIFNAYMIPKYSNPTKQQQAIDDYASNYYAGCLQRL